MNTHVLTTATLVVASAAAALIGVPASAATASPDRYTCSTDGIEGWSKEITADNVNIRTSDGTEYPSLGQVNKGFRICIVSGHRDTTGKHWWHFIGDRRINNGDRWVSAEYTQAVPTP